MHAEPQTLPVRAMACILELVAPDLNPAIVPRQAFERMYRLAKALPLVSLAGFECHLTNTAGRTDMALCFLPTEPERNLLFSEDGADSWMPSGSPEQPDWQRLRTFGRQCRTNGRLQSVRDIWLEFDLDQEFDHLPIPSLFVGVNPAGCIACSVIIAACARHLLAKPLEIPVMERLLRCVEAAPPGGGFYLGLLIGRRTQMVRLSINIPARMASKYLSEVAWPGPIHLVSAILRDLSSHVDCVTLALDVGHGLSPAIGLEIQITHQNQSPLLAYLVAKGLCTESQRDALAGWPGVITGPPDDAAAWIERRLNHLKLHVRPNETLDAKAYIGFQVHNGFAASRTHA